VLCFAFKRVGRNLVGRLRVLVREVVEPLPKLLGEVLQHFDVALPLHECHFLLLRLLVLALASRALELGEDELPLLLALFLLATDVLLLLFDLVEEFQFIADAEVAVRVIVLLQLQNILEQFVVLDFLVLRRVQGPRNIGRQVQVQLV